jgi:uncharacterized protein Yka (UPF0111/DUF47 family)
MSRRRHWFLPEEPDVLGLLRGQLAVTIEAIGRFEAWAAGDASASADLLAAEERGDAARRELFTAVRVAFVTPMEPEDVFTLSRGVDRILDYARDLVSESEAMASPPDARIAEMARLIAEALGHIDEAIAQLASGDGDATAAADAAIRSERRLEQTYYQGMAALLNVEDRTERIARRELYRQCSRIGEVVVDVAERVIYAIVKQA